MSTLPQTHTQFPIDGPWSVRQIVREGKVTILRTNGGYSNIRCVPGYEHRIGVAAVVREPQPTGLPSSAEDIELGQLEDQICNLMEDGGESLLVAITTANGIREFLFYVRSSDEAKARVEQFRSQPRSHEIKMNLKPDPNWEVYGRICPRQA